MTEVIATATALTPIGAVLVLAALAQVAIVQAAKDQAWSKKRTQRVSIIVAAVLGLVAAVVLGMITGLPDSVIQIVSSILLSVAAVAVLGQGLYKVIGYAIPDGRDEDDPGTPTIVVNGTVDPEVVIGDLDLRGLRVRGERPKDDV
ncbi:hypothetical protein [Brachybacterium massiliense]|uniref:hypothetical protein n=1 Tax=Brachybacterium massiliense TaxID=1755098 RepID=UPI000B3BD051|nr:hypothetical protein [Brachybacterium massiliense]